MKRARRCQEKTQVQPALPVCKKFTAVGVAKSGTGEMFKSSVGLLKTLGKFTFVGPRERKFLQMTNELTRPVMSQVGALPPLHVPANDGVFHSHAGDFRRVLGGNAGAKTFNTLTKFSRSFFEIAVSLLTSQSEFFSFLLFSCFSTRPFATMRATSST